MFTVKGGRLISHQSDQTTIRLHTELTLNTVEQKQGAFQVSSKATDTQQPLRIKGTTAGATDHSICTRLHHLVFCYASKKVKEVATQLEQGLNMPRKVPDCWVEHEAQRLPQSLFTTQHLHSGCNNNNKKKKHVSFALSLRLLVVLPSTLCC